MNVIVRACQIIGLIVYLSAVLPAQVTLPDGDGKLIAERMCSTCHGLEEITHVRNTEARWATVVDDMVARGAQGTDAEIDVLIRYLAAQFGPDTGPGSQRRLPCKSPVQRPSACCSSQADMPFGEEPFLDIFRSMSSIALEHVKYGEERERNQQTRGSSKSRRVRVRTT